MWYLLCCDLFLDWPMTWYSLNNSLLSLVHDRSLLWYIPLIFYLCCLLSLSVEVLFCVCMCMFLLRESHLCPSPITNIFPHAFSFSRSFWHQVSTVNLDYDHIFEDFNFLYDFFLDFQLMSLGGIIHYNHLQRPIEMDY